MLPRILLALAIVLVVTDEANADNGLEASFAGPVRPAEPARLLIALEPGCCPPPNCETQYASFIGEVDWGDGSQPQIWLRAGDGKPQANPAAVLRYEIEHAYVCSGRYTAVVTYRAVWHGQDCGATYDLSDSVPVEMVILGTLGVFFDRSGTICSGPVPPETPLYVVAEIPGTEGLAGAEFRVQNSNPGAFSFAAIPEPGWIKIGNVFGDGATMGSNCPPGVEPQRFVILKAIAFPQGDPRDVQLVVERHRTPSNENYRCPMLILCDAPLYTAVVATKGFPAMLNPAGETGPCPTLPVAVQPHTWSQVKNLYR